MPDAPAAGPGCREMPAAAGTASRNNPPPRVPWQSARAPAAPFPFRSPWRRPQNCRLERTRATAVRAVSGRGCPGPAGSEGSSRSVVSAAAFRFEEDKSERRSRAQPSSFLGSFRNETESEARGWDRCNEVQPQRAAFPLDPAQEPQRLRYLVHVLLPWTPGATCPATSRPGRDFRGHIFPCKQWKRWKNRVRASGNQVA